MVKPQVKRKYLSGRIIGRAARSVRAARSERLHDLDHIGHHLPV
jgi:hypothetical protein